MEQITPQEQPGQSPEEYATSKAGLDALAEQLGLLETPELRQLRFEITSEQSGMDEEAKRAAVLKYQTISERVVLEWQGLVIPGHRLA